MGTRICTWLSSSAHWSRKKKMEIQNIDTEYNGNHLKPYEDDFKCKTMQSKLWQNNRIQTIPAAWRPCNSIQTKTMELRMLNVNSGNRTKQNQLKLLYEDDAIPTKIVKGFCRTNVAVWFTIHDFHELRSSWSRVYPVKAATVGDWHQNLWVFSRCFFSGCEANDEILPQNQSDSTAACA